MRPMFNVLLPPPKALVSFSHFLLRFRFAFASYVMASVHSLFGGGLRSRFDSVRKGESENRQTGMAVDELVHGK